MKRLRFWQKTYLLSIALFLAALYTGLFGIGMIDKQQTLASEADKATREEYFIAQTLARDMAALDEKGNLLTSLIASYGDYYRQSGVLIEVKNKGETLYSSLPLRDKDGVSDAQAGVQKWEIQKSQGVPYLYVASRLKGDFEEYTLIYARSILPLYDAWDFMRSLLIWGSAIVSVVLALGLFFILRSLSRPLERVKATAEQFAGGDFNARVTVKGNDEIADLAKSINHMADTAIDYISQIRDVAQKNERMAANLSHEIRTPLTAVRGYAEYMSIAQLTKEEADTALSYIIEESIRLQKISQRMMALTVLKREQIEMKEISLDERIERALFSVAPAVEEKHLLVDVQVCPGTNILGDEVLIESLLTNLLDNAIKACTNHGRITVSLKKEGGMALLSVEDNGHGMKKEEVKRLGEPFYRPDKARSRAQGGAGLGAALCFEIASLHGAKLYYTSKESVGTKASVEFTSL